MRRAVGSACTSMVNGESTLAATGWEGGHGRSLRLGCRRQRHRSGCGLRLDHQRIRPGGGCGGRRGLSGSLAQHDPEGQNEHGGRQRAPPASSLESAEKPPAREAPPAAGRDRKGGSVCTTGATEMRATGSEARARSELETPGNDGPEEGPRVPRASIRTTGIGAGTGIGATPGIRAGRITALGAAGVMAAAAHASSGASSVASTQISGGRISARRSSAERDSGATGSGVLAGGGRTAGSGPVYEFEVGMASAGELPSPILRRTSLRRGRAGGRESWADMSFSRKCALFWRACPAVRRSKPFLHTGAQAQARLCPIFFTYLHAHRAHGAKLRAHRSSRRGTFPRRRRLDDARIHHRCGVRGGPGEDDSPPRLVREVRLRRGLRRRPGCHGMGSRGMRGGGARWALRSVFERLETSPSQERVILAALDEVRENRKVLRDELRQTRSDLARAIEGGLIEDATLEEAYARHDRLLAQLRVGFTEALKKVVEVLDEAQRKELASWLEGGFFRRGWGGPGRVWA